MFNTNDKFNLVLIAFDVDGKQLPFNKRFPIENQEELVLPTDTSFVTLFQYYETSNIRDGKTLFAIYIGLEMPAKNFFDKFLPSISLSPLARRQMGVQKNTWERRFCYSLNPSGEARIVSILESDDRTAPDMESLKQLIMEISLHFEKFNESIQAIKTIGRKITK